MWQSRFAAVFFRLASLGEGDSKSQPGHRASRAAESWLSDLTPAVAASIPRASRHAHALRPNADGDAHARGGSHSRPGCSRRRPSATDTGSTPFARRCIERDEQRVEWRCPRDRRSALLAEMRHALEGDTDAPHDDRAAWRTCASNSQIGAESARRMTCARKSPRCTRWSRAIACCHPLLD